MSRPSIHSSFSQNRLNPYFTGLSILIRRLERLIEENKAGLNPYFTGLSILITVLQKYLSVHKGLNPYFTGLSILIIILVEPGDRLVNVSILILLDYLFLLTTVFAG